MSVCPYVCLSGLGENAIFSLINIEIHVFVNQFPDLSLYFYKVWLVGYAPNLSVYTTMHVK